jgi:hypothetical protein
MKQLWLILAMLAASSHGAGTEDTVYELSVSTDSSWTSLEIRDDAEWVNAPPGKSISVNGRSGIKSYTLSPKKMHLRTMGRGEVTMNLFIKSKNSVLGLELCKGKASSYIWIKSSQSKQKNDTKKKDYCEKAALVLQLH